MKTKKSKYMVLAMTLLLITSSCYQDLGQNPPFDYPEQPTPPPIGEDGQIFYMSFDDDYDDFQSLVAATPIGKPTFADGVKGKAYAGVADSYLTFNTASLAAPLSNEMTFSLWYKMNSTPNRGGILTISPPHKDKPADKQNNRTSGIRIFRENQGDKQRIIANVGNGSTDIGLSEASANLEPNMNEWIHIALVLTAGKASLYLNGEVVVAKDFSGISWTDCGVMSIGSGAPYFTEWGHLSDNSLIDELRIYNKALSADSIKSLIANSKQ